MEIDKVGSRGDGGCSKVVDLHSTAAAESGDRHQNDWVGGEAGPGEALATRLKG